MGLDGAALFDRRRTVWGREGLVAAAAERADVFLGVEGDSALFEVGEEGSTAISGGGGAILGGVFCVEAGRGGQAKRMQGLRLRS